MAQVARAAGAQFQVVDAGSVDELEPAFKHMARGDGIDAVFVDQPAFHAANPNWKQISVLIAGHKLPAIAGDRFFSDTGGLLITYSVDVVPLLRNLRSASARF